MAGYPGERSLALRLAKFLISLTFYPISEIGRTFRRIGRRTSAPQTVVIYYHHVLGQDRQSFARQLDHLLRWTQPLRVDENKSLMPNARYSTVTFDDGWKSFADNALPELKQRRIPITLFAISQRLGKSVDGISFDRLVSVDELRELDPSVVSIGSHTATHQNLTTLNEADTLEELCASRRQLTSILGREVNTFCFPYGAYRDGMISMCRQAGYDKIFTCDPRPGSPEQLVMGRVRVDPTDWPLEFHLKLMGAYRWLPTAIAIKRRCLSLIHGPARMGQRLADATARKATINR